MDIIRLIKRTRACILRLQLYELINWRIDIIYRQMIEYRELSLGYLPGYILLEPSYK